MLAAPILANGQPAKDPVVLWQQNGAWVAESSTWQQLGVTLRPGEEGHDLTEQQLGVAVTYNPENATVRLTIPADRKPAQHLTPRGTQVSRASPAIGGVLVNYNLATQIAGGQQATSLALEARTGGRWGVVSTTGQLNQSPSGFGMRRGMTTWQKDDLQRQRTWQAGDVYATPRIGPVALGGVRLAKDPAALDPLTPTWPVPTLGGIALDPGQVKVLSNHAEITRQDVKAGPFTVDGRNAALGASQTAVVVRDAYGRETAVSNARLYVAPTLLRPGLSAWEIVAGQVREDENRYATAGVSASWAKGVNDRWTIRAGGQVGGNGKGNVTVGSAWAPGTWGVLDGEVGRSSDGGTRWAAAYEYKGPTFGVRLEHDENNGFWRLQSETALPIASRTQASISYRPDRRFAARGTYSAIDTGRSRLAFASLGVSANLGTAGEVSANVLRDLQGDDLQVAASYTYRFGSKASVGVRARQAPGQDSLTTRATYRTEGGLRLAAEHIEGDQGSTRATADAMTRYGDARIMLDRYDGQTQVAANFSGSVFLDHRGVAFGRPAYASYAVVDVPGQAGLLVRVNGAPAGKTNKRGRVLVTNIPALMTTTVSLKDKGLPVGVEIGETEKQSVAPRQGGVRVTFPVLTQNARAFTLTGVSIAPGTLASTPNEQAMVGYDGALYLEHPEPGMAVEVSGVCKAVLPSPLQGIGVVAEVRCD
ncbi:fimbria/pilus outer membrane usher protein [Stenotrophomonas maltophilia]|uniref:fimbria/pilus outer membrane usher protein n=1 Tax=Stenotrophomonas maltophilia TaxID=40324 RepID=UPI0015DEEDA5|nr:fimbria/pilus outer membrane usher protein [Stenotrophomonas maltophilia]MCO7474669.1 fimbria/pilus outer membrane usher protein [Stenotrophomonas maltophilia]UVH74339.1 fimbria/pilus outer membrane usher protein [Stenotrophomonas maltophilia]